jgi:hypothetical protein
MSTQITYNNINPFSGQPLPFIGRAKTNILAGERWGAEEEWTMVGQLTGCSFESLTTAQLNLINSFSRDYQTLEIIENSGVVERLQYVEIDSIQFGSDKYVKILPYTINLSCYPSGYFSGVFGVLEPTNRWELTENKDRTLNITHNISARGFNTSSGATDGLNNAKNWVLGRTGFSTFPEPEFITKYSASGVLLSQVENINRLEGVYGLVETYTLDQLNVCDYGFLRYTVETSSPQAGLSQASINGTVIGGLNENFQLTRNRLANFDFYSNLMYSLDSGVILNPIPVTKQFTEDPDRKTISFSYAYDDNKNLEVNFDYSIVINSGESNIGVSLNGNINGRGELKNKWERAQSYFKTFFEPSRFLYAYSGYSGYLVENGFTGSPNLNQNELSKSVSYDQFNGVISFSYEFSDSPTPPATGLDEFNYSLSFTPPIRKIIAEEVIYQSGSVFTPQYEITDLGYVSRGQFSINGDALVDRSLGLTSGVALKNEVESAIRAKFFDYSTGLSGVYLTQYGLTQSNLGNYSFNAGWTYNYLDALGNTGNHSEIIHL